MVNKNEIRKMKKLHADWFPNVGLSVIVLIRYDGKVEKLDLAELTQWIPNWISDKTTKTVDEMNDGAFQLSDLAQRQTFCIFVDFKSSDPKVVQASYDAISVLEKVMPLFASKFKAFYVADKRIPKKSLGITWNTMPAMAFNEENSQILPYP